MQLHFFAIPSLHPEAAQDELNRFLAGHRVVALERALVQSGPASHWAICVSIATGASPLPEHLKAEGSRSAKLDYKQILSESDFAVFAELRQLRKRLAEEAGVPVYAVFTNEQLAAIVQKPVQSEADLATIEGVGEARIQRYGQAVIACLLTARASVP